MKRKEVIQMPKLFCISDIHSYFDEMKEALDKVGFDAENENHWLITCGDHFDRGPQSYEVFQYLKSLKRKILVRGNHEDLLLECCKRGEWFSYDMSNGTFTTICDLGGADKGKTFEECCRKTLSMVEPFIYGMVNYFETENYIFVHSWIPLKCNDGLPKYYTRHRQFEFNPDWRYAHASEWDAARWGNPFDLASKGLLPDKTIVFGHFHTSYARNKFDGEPEFGENADFSIYHGDGFIGIDACTAYSGKVNILVIEDNFLENPIDKS
jgi:serine/threonine protein phosphatase 1